MERELNIHMQFGISGVISLPPTQSKTCTGICEKQKPDRNSVKLNQPMPEMQTSRLGRNNHVCVFLESVSKLLENQQLFREWHHF